MKKIKARKNLILVGISIIIIFSGIYFYTTYSKIETNPSNYEARKLISTENEQIVENIEEKSRKISDVVEEVTHSVVGISKLKNAGNTIFSNSNEASLGIGTGLIVTDNGYILSNEHVTGSKYSKCYVTLENGTNYDGTVVWEDSNLDLSIIKINAKDLPYVNLGDSKNIRVGETVYAIRKSHRIWI